MTKASKAKAERLVLRLTMAVYRHWLRRDLTYGNKRLKRWFAACKALNSLTERKRKGAG